MNFATFAEHLQKLESTSSRLSLTALLSDLYRELKTEEVTAATYLMQGQLVPPYESLEFQLSVKMVLRALSRMQKSNHQQEETANLFGEVTSENDINQTEQLYKKIGDLGTVTEMVLTEVAKDTKSELSFLEVYQLLCEMAEASGVGSQEKKLELLVALLEQLDPISGKFIARIILGKLRLGFSTMTLIDSLSWTATGSKQDSKMLELAYQNKADIGKLAQAYLAASSPEGRQQALEKYEVEVGVPIVPALCQRLNSAVEIIEKMGEVIAEPKFDGLRVQMHIRKSKNGKHFVRTFTRNLENNSYMFPELQLIIDHLKCESCILDAEAIGFNRETGQLLTFQETITRKRKHDIETTAEQIPVRFYVFDVLNIDGKTLLSEKLQERKELLKSLFNQNEVLYQTQYITTNDPNELRSFHEDQLAEGLEGAVIKQINSVYQPGRKGWSWVKIKEEEGTRGKLRDTLDCVVLGYYVGRGKRTQFGLGAFLVGVLADDQTFKTIAKIGTGLSDEQFKELKERCQPLVTPDQPPTYDVNKAVAPDVWVKPDIVVEIAADEITRSPVHTAGVALRFPRLVTFRDDKKWEDATTATELASIAAPSSATGLESEQ